MKPRRIALLLAAAAALSFLIGASGRRGAWPADWFLIAVASVSREGHFVKTVLAGAAAGLLEDALTQEMLGFNAFAKSAIGYGLALVAVRVILGGSVAVGVALALASLANDAIVAVLALLLMQAPIVLFSREALWRAATTGITAAALEAAAKFNWRDWWEKRRLRRLR
ncbi:MAG: rod shape-determining protein MreD [Thermoanaerobaculia bacterium]